MRQIKERFPMDELEAFKTNLDLTEYAAAQGYELDRRESSRNSVNMRRVVIIKIGGNPFVSHIQLACQISHRIFWIDGVTEAAADLYSISLPFHSVSVEQLSMGTFRPKKSKKSDLKSRKTYVAFRTFMGFNPIMGNVAG